MQHCLPNISCRIMSEAKHAKDASTSRGPTRQRAIDGFCELMMRTECLIKKKKSQQREEKHPKSAGFFSYCLIINFSDYRDNRKAVLAVSGVM